MRQRTLSRVPVVAALLTYSAPEDAALPCTAPSRRVFHVPMRMSW